MCSDDIEGTQLVQALRDQEIFPRGGVTAGKATKGLREGFEV